MILLWDSSAMTVRLTMVDEAGAKTSYEWEAGRTLARDMHSYLRKCLAEKHQTFSDVKGIGVMRGPGSFTGLRIGIVVLNTLAESLGVPIVGTVGNSWQTDALSRLDRGENDRIVLPEYGADAHITTPRK